MKYIINLLLLSAIGLKLEAMDYGLVFEEIKKTRASRIDHQSIVNKYNSLFCIVIWKAIKYVPAYESFTVTNLMTQAVLFQSTFRQIIKKEELQDYPFIVPTDELNCKFSSIGNEDLPLSVWVKPGGSITLLIENDEDISTIASKNLQSCSLY